MKKQGQKALQSITSICASRLYSTARCCNYEMVKMDKYKQDKVRRGGEKRYKGGDEDEDEETREEKRREKREERRGGKKKEQEKI